MWHDQNKGGGLSRIYGFKQFNYLFQIGVMMMMMMMIITSWLGLHVQYQWWWIDQFKIDDLKKKLWKLNSIWMTLHAPWIENKWDANWSKLVVKVLMILSWIQCCKKKEFQKDVDVKTHLSILLYLGMGKQICGYIKSYGNHVIIPPKLISMNHYH
jgi:hypothetical protein